jgi:rhodanese-related sulfurtransferase
MKKDKVILLRQIAVLCALCLVCGTASNLISPRRIAWIEDWTQYVATQAKAAGIATASLAKAKELIGGGIVLIDARSRRNFDAGHIPNAFSLPFEDRQCRYSEFREWLFPDIHILLYCAGDTCDEGILLAKYLKEMGHTNITVFVDGFDGWEKSLVKTGDEQ